MKSTNKLALAALLAATFGASAASPTIDFNVEATIPDNDFYITPVNGWDTQTQKMSWNEGGQSLNAFSQQLQMKNTGGNIKAYLSSQPVLTTANGTDAINLDVRIAGKTLTTDSTTAVELYDATQAAAEKTATVEVSQQGTLSSRPAGGNYIGAVTMIFDTDGTPNP